MSSWDGSFRRIGDTLLYDGKEVATFQMNRDAVSDFRRFVTETFTPDEYFARLRSGETPIEIASSKGYIIPHARRLMRKAGYPLTPEGHLAFLEDKLRAIS